MCPHWHGYRTKFCDATHLVPSDSYLTLTVRWLSWGLDKAAMVIVLEWAAAIDIETSKFWKSS